MKRFNRAIYQDLGYYAVSSISNGGSSIYCGGETLWYQMQGEGNTNLQKVDLNGNLIWVKSYKFEGYYWTVYSPKFIYFKDAIYSSNAMFDGTNFGINITKYDTSNGAVIYSKNIGLLHYNPATNDCGKYLITQLDTTNLLFSCYGHLIKYNVITNSVVAVSYLESGNYALLTTCKLKNSNYSLILTGYQNSSLSPFIIKIKDDNSFNPISGTGYGRHWQLFKKGTNRMIAFNEQYYPTAPNWICEWDTSLTLVKCLKPNQAIDVVAGSFLMRNNRLYIHNFSQDIIIDTSYNCLVSRNEYLPPDMSFAQCASPLTGPSLFVGNGIYSIRTNSCGINNNRSIFIRSDTNFVYPCNTISTPLIYTQTTVPTISNFTFNVVSVTPTISLANYTIMNHVVTDSIYCTTTTDLTTNLISKPNLNLKYLDRYIGLESANIMKEVTLYDIYGREVRKVELTGQNFEIPYSSQPPGVYFVQIFYTDNSSSRVKILLR